ncbi:MAG: hypothetical protein K2H01_09185 [Ruminococcus sp.]|nr:hypothetical protein [Ruminococcus sp.]
MDSIKKNLDKKKRRTYSRYNGNNLRDCKAVPYGKNNKVETKDFVTNRNSITVANCRDVNIHYNRNNHSTDIESLLNAFESGFLTAVKLIMNLQN